MTGVEIAIGKAFFDVFKWAWKEFPAKSVWSKFKHKTAAEAYAKKMKKRYGIMHLWKMSAPTSVEQIYTQVNVLKKQSAFQNIPKDQLEKIYLNQTGFGEVIEAGKDGMLAVREHDRLFILGKPGAGKTTFLKHITLEAIAGKLEAIPIFVRLRDFSESEQALMGFITEQFDICGFPEAQPFIETILKKGKAIVLFDGLDEVNKENRLRDKVIQAIKNFSDKYDESKVLITCRVAATEYNFEGFTTVEMADFDDEQIKTFVIQWFAEDQKTSEYFLCEFEQQAGNRLRDLAKTPLLLTLLCIGFEDTHHFSNRRSEIYEEALDALLKRKDRADGIERDEIYHRPPLELKKQMFAHIAAKTFEGNEHVFEKRRLENRIVDYLKELNPSEETEDIDGEDVLKAIEAQHGIFVECAKDTYSFAHLSFQEYYAARYFLEDPVRRLPRLMKFVGDPRWREVFLLTAEMLDDADVFFELFVEMIDRFLARNVCLITFLLKIEKENHKSFQERMFSLSRILDIAYYIYLHRAVNSLPGSREWSEVIYIAGVAGYYSLAFGRTQTHSISVSSVTESEIAHSIVQTSDDATTKAMGVLVASGPPKTYENYKLALDLSRKSGFESCHQSLENLRFPSEEASEEIWRGFSNSLMEIFKRSFRGEEYLFLKADVSKIGPYYNGVSLLGECLNVAYVSDRAAIEDQLLRPLKTALKESKK